MSLCNYQAVIAEIKAQGDDPTRPASIYGMENVLRNMQDVTARIEEYCQNYFAPYDETRPFDATQTCIDIWRNQLMLDRSLLVADEVKVANNLLTQWDGIDYNEKYSKQFSLYPMERTPATALQALQPFNTWSPYQYGATYAGFASVSGAITVKGTWCFRQHYPKQGWKDSTQTVLNDPLAIDDTEITVTDASVFSMGDYIRIATEYGEVEAVNTTTNVITVERGVRGSDADVHLLDAPIYIWYAEQNIIRAAAKFTALLYARAGIFDKVTINAAGTYATVFDTDMPDEVRNILRQYINIQSAKV